MGKSKTSADTCTKQSATFAIILDIFGIPHAHRKGEHPRPVSMMGLQLLQINLR